MQGNGRREQREDEIRNQKGNQGEKEHETDVTFSGKEAKKERKKEKKIDRN